MAPIFNEEGRGEVYLPVGHWTHYLTGEELALEHGRWVISEDDYFSLPLWVRSNSLIPTLDPSATEDESNPSFESSYEDRLRVEIYNLTENSQLDIYESGEKLTQMSVEVEEDRIKVRFDGVACPLIFMNQNVEVVSGCTISATDDPEDKTKTVYPDEGATVLELKLS